jgi:CoA:oxalate CoA-transferase
LLPASKRIEESFMKKALEGIRVIDLSHVLAAPTTTMFLADLGAEVIHLEPPRGDDSREYGPFAGEPGKNRSGYFISLNRNKKSLVLNLKSAKGKEILRELIGVSDVIVENFRPSTMKKMGFGWEEIQKINPRIIYAAISGFGHDSPPEYAARPSYDMVAQAYSGLMSITGPVGGPPCRVGSSVGDIISGQQAVIGIMAALVYREKTGRGQFYDGSMVDGLFSVLESAIARFTISGKIPGPLGGAHPSITPFEAFRTKDSWVIVAVGNDVLWGKLCRILNREELIRDPRFANNHLRTENQPELSAILTAELVNKTTGEWIEIFEKQDIPYSKINNIKEICEDPVIRHRNMLVTVDQPGVGPIRIAGSPIRLSETPGEVRGPAPLLGEHSAEVLREVLGYTAERIEAMKAEGVINATV